MITFLKLSMHFLMFSSHYVVMACFLFFFRKKSNQLILIQSILLTLSLILFLKSLSIDLSNRNISAFNWHFPNYEIILPIVFYTMLLEKKKYPHLYLFISSLMGLMLLNGYQTVISLMFNLILGAVIVLFIKSLEKTFTKFQCYIVFLLLSISIIPFNMGYYTYSGIYYFWLMVLTYPASIVVRYIEDNYCSSLLSRIS